MNPVHILKSCSLRNHFNIIHLRLGPQFYRQFANRPCKRHAYPLPSTIISSPFGYEVQHTISTQKRTDERAVSHLYRVVSANRLEGVGSTDEQLALRSSYQNTDIVLAVLLQAQTHLISRGLIKTLRTHVVTTFHLTERNQLSFCST